MENCKYTEYDKTDVYNSEILEKVQELLKVCNKEQIPAFISLAVKNDEEKTEYVNEMFPSATNNIFLKNDYFPNFVNVINGFRTVPPQKIVEIDFDE